MWATALTEHTWSIAQWSVVIAACAVGCFIDLHQRRLPNLLTGPLFLAGVVFATCIGGWAGLGESLLAALVLGFPYVLLFIFARGGAGDAKMMGAIGAWLGLSNGLVVLVAVVVAGGVLGVGVSLAHREGRLLRRNMASISFGLLTLVTGMNKLEQTQQQLPATHQMRTMPYGVAIFTGVCTAAAGVLIFAH